MQGTGAFWLLCLLLVTVTGKATSSDTENLLEVEGRGIRDMARDVWEFFFGEGDDYDYDDYNFDLSGNEVSSYSFYEPDFSRRDVDSFGEEEDYSWGEVALGAALALVPIGLLAAAFPAGLFTIAVKKRSFGEENVLDKIDPTEIPLLRSLQEGDLLSLIRPQCQKKLFCELSQLGKHDSASFMQKAFYYAAHLTPDNMSRRFRLQRLFRSARENQCHRYTCQVTSSLLPHESPSNHLEAPGNNQDVE